MSEGSDELRGHTVNCTHFDAAPGGVRAEYLEMLRTDHVENSTGTQICLSGSSVRMSSDSCG